jgi:hypothetical protein
VKRPLLPVVLVAALLGWQALLWASVQITSDTFNRADASTLGGNWTPVQAGLDAHILSNKAVNGSATLDTWTYYSGASWTGGNDQYAECLVVKTPPGVDQTGTSAGPAVRLSTGGALTGYQASIVNIGAGSATQALWKVVAGTGTQLASWSQAIAATDVVRIAVVGTTITISVNGVPQVTATDSAIASGNPGLILESHVGVDDTEADNFAAGTPGASHLTVLGVGGWLLHHP